MLAQLICTVAILASHAPQDNLGPVRTQSFSLPARDVTFISDIDGKEVSGNYSMEIKVTYKSIVDDFDSTPFRTLRMRPEKLAIPFSYTSTFTPGIETNEFFFIGNFSKLGVGFDELEPLVTYMSTGSAQAIGDIQRLKTQVNPNLDLKSGGWTQKTWFRESRMLLADVEVTYIPSGQPASAAIRGRGFSRVVGWYDALDDPDVKFFPDPAAGVPNEIKEAVGGVQLESFDSKEKVSLVIPGLDLASRYAIKPEDPLQITERQYYREKTDALNIDGMGWMKYAFGNNTYQGADGLTKTFGSPDVSQTYQSWIRQGLPSGDSLNALDFPNINVANPCSGEAWFPPGTLWLPDTPGYQPMTTSVGMRFPITDFVAGINGSDLQSNRRMRTHCLDMTLKEPEPGVKYYPFAQPNPVIDNLAQITNASRFRGPWDQARIWQYTDMATFKQISERLFPNIPLSQYVDNLLAVSKAGGYQGMDMAKNNQFEPLLLTAVDASPKALGFVIGQLEASKATELSRWLSGGAEEMEELIKTGGKGKDHAVLVMSELLTSYQGEVRKGALRYLKRTRSELAINQEALSSVLFVGDAGDALLALQVAEQHSTAFDKKMLEHFAEKGGTAEIKSQAKKLLDNMN